MKWYHNLICCLLLVQTAAFGQVKLNQMERSPIKWDIPVAKKKQGTLSGWTQQYMQLEALMDSVGVVEKGDFYISNDTLFHINSLDSVVSYVKLPLSGGTQTITTTGAPGNIALSNGGGVLNLNVNDADANPTNEIQYLNPLIVAGDTVGFFITTAQDTVCFNVENNGNASTGSQSFSITIPTHTISNGTSSQYTFTVSGVPLGGNVTFSPATNIASSPYDRLSIRPYITAANTATVTLINEGGDDVTVPQFSFNIFLNP